MGGGGSLYYCTHTDTHVMELEMKRKTSIKFYVV